MLTLQVHPYFPLLKNALQDNRAALEKYGIQYEESLIKYCGFGAEEAKKLVDNLIETQNPDAIFTTSDRLALDCFSAIKERNISMPNDVAFIGFTNLKVAYLLDPSLSTVVQPAFEIGQAAAQLLLDSIEKKPQTTEQLRTIKIPTELVIRNSSQIKS